ncbi:MAG: DUF349 domain-containing protein [Muribaculaceae bacterium]|nr:DUF349 domain-containing protein [Muribaculaceae bacterium]
MEMREESKNVATEVQPDSTLNEQQATAPVYEKEETVETVDEAEASAEHVRYATIEDVVAALRSLAAEDAENVSREAINSLKQQFYAFRKAEQQAEREAYIEAGNDATGFEPAQSAVEEEFKALLADIKDKKAEQVARLEAVRESNLKLKDEIIAQLLEMSADADNVNREFPRFRELQQQFKTIGEVPATAATDQWKRYQDAVEKFYDQYRINKDLRDYDFKKNLEVKTLLCEEAERLAAEEDVVLAFRRLQELHDKWRETGPVAKEMREDIWMRFKDASAIVNKKYQAFFEERKEREQHNEQAKTALCERIEAMDATRPTSYKEWDEQTAKVLAAQEEWKSLGYASKKNNNKLFARFRAACDRFFTDKAEYYKNVKDQMSENLRLKTELCEQAEALRESTDWRKTADKLMELQKKWKAIGSVPKRQSDAIWKRFQDACDYFFEQKKKDLSETRHAEQAALKAKKAIIGKLKEVAEGFSADQVSELLKACDEEWRQAGHVPFRDKDKIYDEYRGVVKALQDKFGLSRAGRSMARFEANLAEISDSRSLNRERERLVRAFEQKKNELKTCENNLGFFTTKSRSGNAMLQELERRMAAVKEDIETLRNKIALIDQKI